MAYVSSLKHIWEKADNSYIQATKSGERAPVSRKSFPDTKCERNRTGKEPQTAGNRSECDDVSEDACNPDTFENFDAIPEEFRPSKQGKNLLKVMTSPKKSDSKEKSHQNERYQIMQSESQRKRGPRNSNSSTIQNNSKNYKKESLKTEDSDQPQGDIDLISDEAGKQKNSSGIFFFNGTSRRGSTAKVPRERQESCSGKENSPAKSSEKSNLKNVRDESTQCKFFHSNSSQSKETNDFDIHSSFAQNKDEIKSPKFNKDSLSNFQNPTENIKNKVSFVETGIQKITRETTVTKRIQWKSDLCRIKKSENEPNMYYEFTKTTKQSMRFVSSDNEKDDELTKMANQDFKKEHNFCSDFRRKCSVRHNDKPKRVSENRKDEGFDSRYTFQRKVQQQFVPGRTEKSANKFEEKHNYSQCCKDKDTIIIKHEVKVFHMNGRGKNNGMFHNSFKTNRPPKKDRNGRIINTGDRQHYGMKMGKTGQNKMAKMEEAFQKTKNNDERQSVKLTDSFAKTKHAHDSVSVKSNKDSNDNAAILFESGREISGMIVGSSVAIRVFLDNYEQWKDIRRMTMLLFEEFEKNLSQSCNRNKRIIEVAAMVGSGFKMIQYVPHVGVSIAAKIVACLSEVVSRMFTSSKSAKSIGMDDFQLRLCLQRDMEATSDIYLYGLQCDLQFQETCKIIEEFYRKIKDGLCEKFVETFETGFLKEILLLSPNYPEVFYKRLERFYILLNGRYQSEEGKAFCKAFEDWPDALTTISRLPRRFKTENWDSSPVLKTWEEIYNLLQNDQSVVEDVLKKIQDCICVLMREQSVIEKYVKDLQRRS